MAQQAADGVTVCGVNVKSLNLKNNRQYTFRARGVSTLGIPRFAGTTAVGVVSNPSISATPRVNNLRTARTWREKAYSFGFFAILFLGGRWASSRSTPKAAWMQRNHVALVIAYVVVLRPASRRDRYRARVTRRTNAEVLFTWR
jgi:hypothetical protein